MEEESCNNCKLYRICRFHLLAVNLMATEEAGTMFSDERDDVTERLYVITARNCNFYEMINPDK